MISLRASLVALLPVLACITGCGTTLSPTTATGSTFADATGDWRFSGSDATFSLAAALVDNAGSITGTATVVGCGAVPAQTTLTGSVNSQGNLSLQTAPLASAEDAKLLLQGQLSTDGKTVSGVSVSASGAGCALPSNQEITGQVYAPASGNYTGYFTVDGDQVPVTATLSQNSTAGPGGSYTLSGSVSFAASPCLDTATIDSATSTVTGGNLSATYTTTVNGQTVTISAVGTADSSATNINITSWTLSGGMCDGYSGTGTLTAAQ